MNDDAELVIGPGKGRQLQRRKPRRNEFTQGKRKRFLEAFSATCNVAHALQAAGVSRRTVYETRRKDPAFEAAWEAAQEQGYAALEAELVRKARELLDGIGDDDAAAGRIPGMDAKLAFSMLQRRRQQKQNSSGAAGDVQPRRSDLAEATKRLEKVMRRMKLLAADPVAGSAK